MWFRYLLVMLFVGLFAGCFTPNKERQIKNDIYGLQTRVLQLETGNTPKQKASDTNSKKSVGSIQNEIERLTLEVQRLKGEVDALKIGVARGQMPGAEEDENSVAGRLNKISERLDVLEGATAAVKAESVEEKKSPRIRSLKSLRVAFNSKKYLHVVDNGGEVYKRQKSNRAKEETLFLWAESLYKLGRMRDAALKFNEFSEKHGKSKRMAEVKLRMGDCFRNLQDTATAKLYYQEVTDVYPKSAQAKKAKEQLGKL